MTIKVTEIAADTVFEAIGGERLEAVYPNNEDPDADNPATDAPPLDAVTADDIIKATDDVKAFNGLTDALTDSILEGSAFRIAFKKPGDTEWTRVLVQAEDLLQYIAVAEMGRRRATLVGYLRGLVDKFVVTTLTASGK